MNPFSQIKKGEELDLVNFYLGHIKNNFSDLKEIVNTISARESYEKETVKTMAVTPSISGGTWLVYNPKFVLENHNFFCSKMKNAPVNLHYIYNVLSHEIMHICLNHIERMKAGRFHPKLWNLATDTLINYQFDWNVCKRIIHNPYEVKISKNHFGPGKSVFSQNHELFKNAMTPLMRSSSKVFDLISPASCWNVVIDKCVYLTKEKLKQSYDGIKVDDASLEKEADAQKFGRYHFLYENKAKYYKEESGILVNRKKAFSSLKGFDPNFRFAKDFKDVFKNANKTYNRIVEWIEYYEIDNNSTAKYWYDAYKELYELLYTFEKDLDFFVDPPKSVLPDDGGDKYENMPIPTFGGMGNSGELTKELAESIFNSSNIDDGCDEENASNAYYWAEYDLSGTSQSSKDFKEKAGSKIKRDNLQGNSASKDKGSQSDILIIDRIKSSYSVEWHVLLDNIVSNSMRPKYESTIFRPNRRWGLKMPGKKVEWEGSVNIAIDTSGSVRSDDIDEFFLSLKHAANKNKNLEFNIILFHSCVYREYLDFNIKSGEIHLQTGGTSFEEPLKRLEELNRKNYGICIMFTDGMCKVPKESDFNNKFINSLHWVFWVEYHILNGRYSQHYFGNGKNIFLR